MELLNKASYYAGISTILAKRCITLSNSNSCSLGECKKECFEKYNGNGGCNLNVGTGESKCFCAHECPPRTKQHTHEVAQVPSQNI